MGRLLLRIIFALLCGLLGLAAGIELAQHVPLLAQFGVTPPLRDIGLPVLFAAIGIAVSPFVAAGFERISSSLEEAIVKMAPAEALSGAIGLVVGLLVAYLVRDVFQPVRQIPRFGALISVIIYALITLFFAYTGIRIGLRQRLSSWMKSGPHDGAAPPKLLDTSVIVDGRLLEVVQAGFIEGRLLVPKFVLKELQLIADSADSMRRARGRRGLEILNRLREASGRLEIIEQDAPERDVDSKLVTPRPPDGRADPHQRLQPQPRRQTARRHHPQRQRIGERDQARRAARRRDGGATSSRTARSRTKASVISTTAR